MAEPAGPLAIGGDEEDVAPSSTLNGVGAAWERDEIVRQKTLKEGQLLSWLTAKLTGVVTFQTIAHNARVMDILLNIHCSRIPTPKTVNMDKLRGEVGWSKVETQFGTIVKQYQDDVEVVIGPLSGY